LFLLCIFFSVNKQFKCIVFVSTCDSVDFHFSLFGRSFWPDDLPERKRNKIRNGNQSSKSKQRSGDGDEDEDDEENIKLSDDEDEDEDKPEPINLDEGIYTLSFFHLLSRIILSNCN
jgi:hypothetical protein